MASARHPAASAIDRASAAHAALRGPHPRCTKRCNGSLNLVALPAAGGGVGACADERLVHDALDRPHAPPALRAASEAAMHVNGRSRRGFLDGGADLLVGQNVAGADDHLRTNEPR